MLTSRRLGVAVILLSLCTRAALAAGLTFLTEESPPFNYTEGGKLTGAGTEIVQQIASRAGIPVKVRLRPICGRCTGKAISGCRSRR